MPTYILPWRGGWKESGKSRLDVRRKLSTQQTDIEMVDQDIRRIKVSEN